MTWTGPRVLLGALLLGIIPTVVGFLLGLSPWLVILDCVVLGLLIAVYAAYGR